MASNKQLLQSGTSPHVGKQHNSRKMMPEALAQWKEVSGSYRMSWWRKVYEQT